MPDTSVLEPVPAPRASTPCDIHAGPGACRGSIFTIVVPGLTGDQTVRSCPAARLELGPAGWSHPSRNGAR